jgi:hypothetical protein
MDKTVESWKNTLYNFLLDKRKNCDSIPHFLTKASAGHTLEREKKGGKEVIRNGNRG